MKTVHAFAAMALSLSLAGAASADVVFDQSPDVSGVSPSFTASNIAQIQNFLLEFTLGSETELTGADIYSDCCAFSEQQVILKFREDVMGNPAASNLFSFSSLISAIDNDGSSTFPSLKRLHADFTPFTLAAGTYWFGMSGDNSEAGLNLNFSSPSPYGAWQLSGDNLQFSFGNNTRFAYRLEGTSSAAPEPAAWALMIGGFGLVGTVLRRRRTIAA